MSYADAHTSQGSSGVSPPVRGVAAFAGAASARPPSARCTSQIQPEPNVPSASASNCLRNASAPPNALSIASASAPAGSPPPPRSEEHTSELQSLMRISYAVFCLKKKKNKPEKQREEYKDQHEYRRK